MLYYAYELQRQLAKPIRLWANALEQVYSSPYNPLAGTWFGKSVAASAEIVARLTQNYTKPEFGLKTTQVGNETVAVNEEILLRKPFCQPSVPVLAAASLMAEAKDPRQPKSITLMGGPIDTRLSPTTPNDLAMRNSMMWFRQNVISTVPINYPGALRRVYPGFLQLTSFISMNLDRHINAHMRQFEHLV